MYTVLTAADGGDASDGEITIRRPDKKLRYGFHAIRGKRQQRLDHRAE